VALTGVFCEQNPLACRSKRRFYFTHEIRANDSRLFVEIAKGSRSCWPKTRWWWFNSNDVMPTTPTARWTTSQNADLFYLTGIRQEESVLVLAPNAFDEKQRKFFLRRTQRAPADWKGTN